MRMFCVANEKAVSEFECKMSAGEGSFVKDEGRRKIGYFLNHNSAKVGS